MEDLHRRLHNYGARVRCNSPAQAQDRSCARCAERPFGLGTERIRLREWDPYLFTQEVMTLAYRQLMLLHAGLSAKRAFPEVVPPNGRRSS